MNNSVIKNTWRTAINSSSLTNSLRTYLKTQYNKYLYISKSFGESFLKFIKWLVIAVILGLFVGLVGVGFHYCLSSAAKFRAAHEWLIFFLPLAGLFIILCYKTFGMYNDKGTNLVLMAVRDNEPMTAKTVLLIFSGTVLTHLFGGSAGREGAALQIGGTIGSLFGKIIKLDDKDERVITMCGMSAGFAALFGTPVTSSVFAMEVTSVGVMYYSAIVPCVVSAFTASSLAKLCGVEVTRYTIIGISEISVSLVLKVILLALLCAVISLVFCLSMRGLHHVFQKIGGKNKFIRIFVGGVVIIIITLLVGSQKYNGAGTEVINQCFNESVGFQVFALKILLTAVTLGCGFKGGEIVPTFFTGSAFGSAMSSVLGISPSLGAGVGLVSVFCGVTNCPLTSIILSVELFGSEGVILFAAACAISYMLSGYIGLYNEQTIVYSKTKTQYIDKSVAERSMEIKRAKLNGVKLSDGDDIDEQ